MQVHSIARILTFNGSDFARFPGIAILDQRASEILRNALRSVQSLHTGM
jgi:hypothetical protein